MYKLVSLLSLFGHGLMGTYDSVSEAADQAIFFGLPGEEFAVVRVSDGKVVAKAIAPETKLVYFEAGA